MRAGAKGENLLHVKISGYMHNYNNIIMHCFII